MIDRVKCSGRCMGRIALWLDLESGSDVRESVGMNFSVTVNHGCCQW